MEEKGFTLIELLAVIVILAIIALIATPIVLDIINDTKRSSTLRSGEFYLDAVEQAIAKEMMNDATFKAKECIIKEDGNLLCSELGFTVCEERITGLVCSGAEKEVKVEVSGEKPTEGIIELNNGNVEDSKFTISSNSLVMKENNLVFENDAELVYEKKLLEGETAIIPNIFEYNTVYNVICIAPDVEGEINVRAVLGEINNIKYLKIDGMGAVPFNTELGIAEIGSSFKIEKTNQRLEDYSITLSPKYITIFSNYFVPGNIKISVLDENGTEIYNGNETLDESVVEGYAMDFHFMGETVGNTCYNLLKENKKLYIRIEQEIDGKKVIRQFGSIPPKYQEIHPYVHANDSYYWGSNFLPANGE